MASTILLKSRQADATGPAASGLKIGELAVNTFDGRVYLGTDLNNGSASAGGTADEASFVGAVILDENNMASDSDKHLATQQSIKKYVDDQVANLGEGDITGVTAGDGLSGGGDTGALTLALDLNELGTETSIDQADFIAMVDATDNGSEKITFSNLEDTIFGNISGDATVAAGGELTIANTSVTNAMLAGSIGNSKLSNSTISGVTLGNNLNALTVDDSSLELNTGTTYNGSGIRTISVKDSGITNAMLAGSIAISKLAANDVTIAADSGTSHAIDLGETLTVSGTSNEIETSISNNTLTVGLPDDVTIGGNLTVSGTTTTVQHVAVGVSDTIIFEGSSDDDHETTLTVANPTDDRIITLPNVTGTVITTGDSGTVTNSMLANNAVSIGGVSIALGGSDATPALDLTDATNYPTSSLTGTITNAQLAGSIANDKLANSTISGIALGGNLSLLTVDDSSLELNSGTTYNGSAGRTISVKDSGITNAMLAGSIENTKLANSAITIAGASTALGASISAATIAAAIDGEAMTIDNATISGGAYST
tara:strand:- start:201 stop:1829 length:1629 start_codon:yes stop_codon:yes gene_type:complete